MIKCIFSFDVFSNSTSTSIEISSNGLQRIVVNFSGSIYLSASNLVATSFVINGDIDGTSITSTGTIYNTGNGTTGVGSGSLNFVSDILTNGSHTLQISIPALISSGGGTMYYSISVHTII